VSLSVAVFSPEKYTLHEDLSSLKCVILLSLDDSGVVGVVFNLPLLESVRSMLAGEEASAILVSAGAAASSCVCIMCSYLSRLSICGNVVYVGPCLWTSELQHDIQPVVPRIVVIWEDRSVRILEEEEEDLHHSSHIRLIRR
jgi:hypothetical protein